MKQKTKLPQTHLILLASGLGLRLGTEIPKQFIKINSYPIFLYSLKAFLNSKNITLTHCIISVPNKFLSLAETLLQEGLKNQNNLSVKIQIIQGGESRHESCLLALQKLMHLLDSYEDSIIIHDGARPLLHIEEFDWQVLATALLKEKKRVISFASPISDTLVMAKSQMNQKGKNSQYLLEKCIDRKKSYSIQTPQALSAHLANSLLSFSKTELDEEIFTDLLTWASFHNIEGVLLVRDFFNFKITTKKEINYLRYMLDCL